MHRRSNSGEENLNSNEYYRNLINREITNEELYELSLRYYYLERHLEECEDQIVPEVNKNPNFLHEKDIKFRLYPFYINWKKIEANKDDYYEVFVHFGYFGASIYSTFKEIYPDMNYQNIFLIFTSFCYEFLMNEKNKEEYEKEAEIFIARLPKIEEIFKLIKDKVIMFKEVPMLFMILKIFEIYYIYYVEAEKLNELLKYQFLLNSYLTDDEYQEIFSNNFKGKVSKVFKKLGESLGEQFDFPKSRTNYLNHLKYVYQGINQNKSDENTEKESE